MKINRNHLIIIAYIVALLLIGFLSVNLSGEKESPNNEEASKEEITDEKTGEDAQVIPQKQPTNAVAQPKATPKKVAADCKPVLSAKSLNKPRSIVLTWTPCLDDDFQLYRLLRSNVNNDPSYLSDVVVINSNKAQETNYVDKNLINRETYHYKLCVFKKLEKVSCSNVVSEVF